MGGGRKTSRSSGAQDRDWRIGDVDDALQPLPRHAPLLLGVWRQPLLLLGCEESALSAGVCVVYGIDVMDVSGDVVTWLCIGLFCSRTVRG